MNRLWGIVLMVVALYALLLAINPGARSLQNNLNLASRTGLYGVLTLGAGLLIVAGGIDLSIGSVVGLSAVALGLLLEQGLSPELAILLVLAMTACIGAVHGLLITRLRLQPFILTLCGLFIYRGLAQWLTSKPGSSSRVVGLGNVINVWSVDRPELAAQVLWVKGFIQGKMVIFLLMLAAAAVAAAILHLSVYGRYLYAIGYNEQAARYAGIPTDRYKVFAYAWCSLMAGFGGILLMFDTETAQPSTTGNWYELYAITGAVLGGCSLRGGQGTVIGMILGTAVLPILRNLCNFADIPSELEFTVIGVALLCGTIADELLKRRSARVAR